VANSSSAHDSMANSQHLGINFEQVNGNSGFNQRLDQAVKNSQVVMLDFYADWCASCKEMEAITFIDETVLTAAQNIISVQVDVTDNTDEDQALLKRFSLIGPPAILFFDKNGQELKSQRLVGYADAETLVKHINNARTQ
jgi:thiol:disulfide interchange protein DsbD